jgi:hypothetical protein
MLRTFFRHFCLYEYSFKPKVDLILMTIPAEIPGNHSQNGSKLTNHSQMDGNKITDLNLEAVNGQEAPTPEGADASPVPESAKIDHIDWDKVGKIYKPESAIEDIISREMGRLGKVFEMQIDAQDTELEDKYKNAKKK